MRSQTCLADLTSYVSKTMNFNGPHMHALSTERSGTTTRPSYLVRIITITLLCQCLVACSLFVPASEDYGKRTWGTRLDDQMNEARGRKVIRDAHPELENAHFAVTSFNGVVLLTGQVASEDSKQAAGSAIENLRKVHTVHNELTISGPTTLVARGNDSFISTKVKSALIASKTVNGRRIKVITEDGVVYLMGLLTRDEAEAAVTKARSVYGVQKIVKAFEYIN